MTGFNKESYARLLEYIEEIKERNPRTIASYIAQCPESAQIFKRVFISFITMMTGFNKGCISLVGVDDYFLEGPYKGVLLTAMALNANNGYFPRAYGVVKKEKSNNWTYIFRALKLCLQGADCTKMDFISDRHSI